MNRLGLERLPANAIGAERWNNHVLLARKANQQKRRRWWWRRCYSNHVEG